MCPVYYTSPGHPNGWLGVNHSCIYTAWLAVLRRYGGRSARPHIRLKPTLTPSPLRQICNFTATPPAPVPNKSQLSPDDTHGELRKSNGMGAFERRFIKYKYHADTVTDTIKARIRTFTTAPSPPPTCKSTHLLGIGGQGRSWCVWGLCRNCRFRQTVSRRLQWKIS